MFSPDSLVRTALFSLAAAFSSAALPAAVLDTARIEAIVGIRGVSIPAEGVFKVMKPRTDVTVKVDGWKVPPFMGLGSWAAFEPGGKSEAMVMGDFVLFEDEVDAAVRAALDNGLEVTALHNHFLDEHPRVYFMHIGGDGSVVQLATGVRAVFDAVARCRAGKRDPEANPRMAGIPDGSAITALPLEQVFHAKAAVQAGMVKFVFGRRVTMGCGCTAGKEMGVNTWAAFAGTDDRAVVDGDFAVTADELQPALKSLVAGGIRIVAIHSHMTEDSPHLIFFHYWGEGKAVQLAATVRTALGGVSP